MSKNAKGRRSFIQKMALGATSLSGIPLLLSREEQVNQLRRSTTFSANDNGSSGHNVTTDGTLSGTTPEETSNNVYSFTVGAFDGLDTEDRIFSLTINQYINPNYLMYYQQSGGFEKWQSASDDVFVEVNSVVANAGLDRTITQGETVNLTAAAGGERYLWSNGETTKSIAVSPESTSVYSVKVMSGNCEDSD